jgi:hypothetical protein
MVATLWSPSIVGIPNTHGYNYVHEQVSTTNNTPTLVKTFVGCGWLWAVARADGGLTGTGKVQLYIDGVTLAKLVTYRNITAAEMFICTLCHPFFTQFDVYLTADGTTPVYMHLHYLYK